MAAERRIPAYDRQPGPDPAHQNDAHKTGAETSRQEGAQGRVGRTPDDTADDGSIDASDPKMGAQKY
jgi:hypothetical protein